MAKKMAKTTQTSKKKSTKKTTTKPVAKKSAVKKSVGKESVVKPATKKSAHKTKIKPSLAEKVNAQETQRHAKKHSEKDNVPLILTIVGLAIIVVALYFIFSGSDGGESSNFLADDPEVAAVVNGNEIKTSQLNAQYAILPEQYKQQFTRRMILDQLIDEELVLQLARENGASVTKEDVNKEVQTILESGALTLQDLQDNLDRFNFTIEDFENLIERKLLIEQGIAALSVNLSPITAVVAGQYYQENKESFLLPEQVKVRHVLIASQRENAAQLGKDIMERVEAGEDFCAIVEEESDDKGSLKTCGEYTFPKGYMVPEFETASFEMEKGDVTLIQTIFGYHVIEKLEYLPESTPKFIEVEDEIMKQLEQEQRTKAYIDYIAEQRANADIQINLDK